MEDGLCLTTIPRLLAIVTALSLCEEGVLALLVLGHLMGATHSAASVFGPHEIESEHTCASCMFYPCRLSIQSWSIIRGRMRHSHLQVLRVLEGADSGQYWPLNRLQMTGLLGDVDHFAGGDGVGLVLNLSYASWVFSGIAGPKVLYSLQI